MTSTTYNEDHLRHLLDQRAARAHLHGRFPSQSDFSDSPSIYSHAPFSPQQPDIDAHSVAFHYTVSSHNQPHPSPDVRTHISDRERLNYPGASSLDLDDDSQSSLFLGDSVEDDDDVSSQTSQEDDSEAEVGSRVSTYGPKMRFHSRAPWETGEDEELEQEESSRSKKRHGGKKSWGLSSKSSSDPRPSTESTRSHGKVKQSLDVPPGSSNGGALFALAQASMSSTSLGLSSSSHQPGLRDKLRLRSRTNSSARGFSKIDTLDTQSIRSVAHSYSAHPSSPYRSPSPTESFFSQRDVGPPFSGPPSPRTPIHPYANPDLCRETTHHDNSSQQNLSDLHAQASTSSCLTPNVNRSESGTTFTDSSSSTSMTNSNSDSTVTLTPVTSMSSIQSKREAGSAPRTSNVHGKGISGPIAVNKPSLRVYQTPSLSSGPVPMSPGWQDGPPNSTIKLISLEEAQAQVRERSRSATATATSLSLSISGASHDNDMEPPLSPAPHSQSGWSRMRSASAGSSKSRNAVNVTAEPVPPLPTEYSQDGNNAMPPKVITKKKSGFMRLFNGKERPTAIQVPPPMPSPTQTAPPSPSYAVPRKGSLPRVPVPSISPSLLESEPHHSGSSAGSTPEHASGGPVQQQLSARRNVPGLSIVTHGPGRSSHRSASPGRSEQTYHTHLLTPTTAASGSAYTGSSIPSSAPPTSSDFLGVDIGRMSTTFSKTLPDYLLVERASSEQNRPSLDADTGTPTTASAISPRSPAFPVRASDEKHLPIGIASQQEDQSSVIQALQEQIMTAKKAWQRQIWELEGQVRDLKAEVDVLRASEHSQDYCSACGRGSIGRPHDDMYLDVSDATIGRKAGSVVNRPRARTGVGSRFASAV